MMLLVRFLVLLLCAWDVTEAYYFLGEIAYNRKDYVNSKSSKDFTKCKWITSMSKEELMYFVDGLESLVPASSS